jgi:ring-1,2-phenylacetyl-CoA epoxidase subunit PaaD
VDTGLATRARCIAAQVCDPEIPVLTIEELGVLRDVIELGESSVQVVLTPTYSACPAIDQMGADVIAALAEQGIAAVITHQLSPAWTTDWLGATAHDKLREYGITPPGGRSMSAGNVIQFTPKKIALKTMDTLGNPSFSLENEPLDVPCPRCASVDTTEISHFGSTACKALYRCLNCMEPFDFFKPH